MIVVIEPVCKGWAHELGNAGMLELINSISSDQVVFLADKEHIRCIQSIYVDNEVEYDFIEDMGIFDRVDDYTNLYKYFIFLNRVIKKYKPKIIFILAAYRPFILATEMVCFLHREVKFFLTLHRMIEFPSRNHRVYKRLLNLGNRIMNLIFLTYSPFCTSMYWGVSENKIIFIDHPYVLPSLHEKNDNEDITVIGIIGQCANIRARNIIREINRRKPNGKYVFWIMSKNGNDFVGLNNTIIKDIVFERTEFNKALESIDYLLLPYKEEYDVSASGVLWDGVVNDVPCLMLDSRYFEYYSSYNIGFIAHTITDLVDIIVTIIEGKDNIHVHEWYIGLESLKYKNIDNLRSQIME